MYQLFRSLAYIHSQGVCHRDIKPQNLLVDPETAILKLCDFGSAKQLVRGEPNVSYICSRYYRAPELIFGATDYTSNIDIWSAGCVLAELLLGQPIFPGDSGVDQLVEIIKVLGTPTREQIREMNPNYTEFKFPQIKAHPWTKVFKPRTPPEAIALCSRLLEYTPVTRLSPLEACAHAFFDELRQPNTRLPSGRELPHLFNFSPVELSIQPQLNTTLIPPHARAQTSPASHEGSVSDSTAQPSSAPGSISNSTWGFLPLRSYFDLVLPQFFLLLHSSVHPPGSELKHALPHTKLPLLPECWQWKAVDFGKVWVVLGHSIKPCKGFIWAIFSSPFLVAFGQPIGKKSLYFG